MGMPTSDTDQVAEKSRLIAYRDILLAKVKHLIENFHGHPNYLELTLQELDLHSRKNKDYAQGGDPLGNFRRVAKIFANYPNLKLSDPAVIALVYQMKQLDATLWMLNGNYEGDVEGKGKRLEDMYIYDKIARILIEEDAKCSG